ncbi:MAG: DNA-binding response regulator [Betaproteobacteria bacterium RIFCSPLOWO2_12_FULL_63_13]|nr:MAG: DNA-binding response regulator [Betaproteobacteria bacterium RIFCSPLOWO2_12_FULL_63_13]
MSRILIVEDEPSIALALEDDLRHEGYETEVVSDGDAAVERGAAGTFDLILLDVMLPHRDGFEVCRALRRAGIDTTIVLLTARTQEAEKVLGLEAGADDYVTKPYSPRELRARVKAHLRRSARPHGDVFRFGDAELNFTRCELRRSGKAVDLSALEFKLLAAFVKRSGRLLTRAQLLDEVWGHDAHVTDRVVDNQVTNLRRKIEPDPERPRFLVSLRGLGYRFDGEGMTER